jgi:hypothetical protein
MFSDYQKEIRATRWYTLTIIAVVLACYAIYPLLPEKTIAYLEKEDHFFEWATAISFLIGSILFFAAFRVNRSIFLLMLAVMLFFGAGEEISWGQRLAHFQTPSTLDNHNVQHEFNLHNIEVFNTVNFKEREKTGWERLHEISFLFRVFFCLFGIALPLVAWNIKPVGRLIRYMRMPVPPVSIGIFFIVSWLIFKGFLFLEADRIEEEFVLNSEEVFEFLASFVFLAIAAYFYNNRRQDILGYDIKHAV